MANRKNKWQDNVSGVFYVDDQCIACDACCLEAPDFFVMNKSESHAFVQKQPQMEEEIIQCKAALDACPVEAIGSDGVEN